MTSVSNKTTLSLQPGTEVYFKGQRGHITNLLGFDEVLVVNAVNGTPERVRVIDLQPNQSTELRRAQPDPQTVPDEDWQKAQQRFEIIRPLLDPRGRTRQRVEDQAKLHGMHTNTLYKWLSTYESEGRITALLPKDRADKGTTKLSAELEAIISAAIEDQYLTQQRKSIAKLCIEVQRRCHNAGLTAPHNNTVRKRVTALSEELKISRRYSSKAAEHIFSPIRGAFPGADYPQSIWQIDHTKLDIILVDDIHRRAIGRPWITLAIDVFSRLVAGFYISFDPPGALATGLCLAHGILPKASWLATMNIAQEWPVWGLPVKVHADNAKEFRGSMLQRACQQYGINLEWRPVARPHFGGHIERLLGTFLKEIHTLPGTTFSSVKDRRDYDSDKAAILTLSELEQWLTTYIVEVYQTRVHSELGMSPVNKYRAGVFGSADQPGVGLPAKIIDEMRLKLDFVPYVERTVQDYGVVIDDIHYYHDVLRRWINAQDPDQPKVKRKFMFRRDPRDISVIWFYDPEVEIYYPIPYRDISHPAVSIWELREAKRIASEQGADEHAEHVIFTAYDRMRQIEDEAQVKTKAVRRAVQRRGLGLDRSKDYLQRDLQYLDSNKPPELIETSVASRVLPFDELDDMPDD